MMKDALSISNKFQINGQNMAECQSTIKGNHVWHWFCMATAAQSGNELQIVLLRQWTPFERMGPSHQRQQWGPLRKSSLQMSGDIKLSSAFQQNMFLIVSIQRSWVSLQILQVWCVHKRLQWLAAVTLPTPSRLVRHKSCRHVGKCHILAIKTS